jgi:hypothetical protein
MGATAICHFWIFPTFKALSMLQAHQAIRAEHPGLLRLRITMGILMPNIIKIIMQ